MAEEVDRRTRAQAVKELNARRAEERKRVEDGLKSAYAAIADDPAFKDILAKARQFAAYHTKVAKDRVGMRANGTNASGETKYEEYNLTEAERLANLDNAAGIEELLAYIERKLEI